jgi:hypothetical protein
MKAALLMLIFVTAGSPVLAKPYHAYQNSGQAARTEASPISCDTVRAYVGQVVWCRPRRWLGRRDDSVARTESKAVLGEEGLIYTNESNICPTPVLHPSAPPAT